VIEEALNTVLEANSAVVALVSGRIYPVLAPEPPQYPFIAYTLASETNYSAMGTDAGTLRRRYQFDCYDKTATGASNLADAVKAALLRYRGTVNYTGGSTVIRDIFALGQVDLFDFEARKFKRAVDFDVVYDG